MSIIHLLSLKLYKILMVAEEPLNSTLTGSKWKAVFLTFPVELSLALSVWYHLLHMTTWLLFWFF
jgi:hypothetical protein